VHLPVLEKILINRQCMAGIGRSDERAPANGPQVEFLHHTANPFAVDWDALAIQFFDHATITIAREFLLNSVDLLPQLLVFLIAALSMLRVGLVIERAGGDAGYLAGLRN
jgi:hypothetical protein